MAKHYEQLEAIAQPETFCSDCQSEINEDTYPIYIIKQDKKRKKLRKSKAPRLLERDGTFLIHRARRPFVALKYLHDLSNTVLNSSWKWTLVALSISFMLTWLIFASFWLMVAASNGDLDEGQSEPCLSGIQSFAGYLLFSIESQTSIGFGSRFITHYCPEAVVLLCIQITCGIAVSGLMVGIVFQKLKGAKRGTIKSCFSKRAIICQRDGELCLMFRVRDCEGRYQCHNEIKAYLVQKRGDEVCLKSIKLEPIGILLWPVEVVHRITPKSPFWDLSARDLIIKRFEIIVSMEGISLSTCNTSSISVSYTTQEIVWGRAFVPCVFYDKENRHYFVNHRLFNSTREILTPLCSPKRLQQVFWEISSSANSSTPNYGDSNSTYLPCLSRFASLNNGNPDRDEVIIDVHAFKERRKEISNSESGTSEEIDELLTSLQNFIATYNNSTTNIKDSIKYIDETDL